MLKTTEKSKKVQKKKFRETIKYADKCNWSAISFSITQEATGTLHPEEFRKFCSKKEVQNSEEFDSKCKIHVEFEIPLKTENS